jgi:hypothetical protein
MTPTDAWKVAEGVLLSLGGACLETAVIFCDTSRRKQRSSFANAIRYLWTCSVRLNTPEAIEPRLQFRLWRLTPFRSAFVSAETTDAVQRSEPACLLRRWNPTLDRLCPAGALIAAPKDRNQGMTSGIAIRG